MNAQKRRFLNTLQNSTTRSTKTEQGERVKPDTLGSVFVSRWMNENRQKQIFFLRFCTEMEDCERVAWMR